MYRKDLTLDKDSYIELASRLLDSTEHLSLTLRGQKSSKETVLASVLLDKQEVATLIEHLSGWLEQK